MMIMVMMVMIMVMMVMMVMVMVMMMVMVMVMITWDRERPSCQKWRQGTSRNNRLGTTLRDVRREMF